MHPAVARAQAPFTSAVPATSWRRFSLIGLCGEVASVWPTGAAEPAVALMSALTTDGNKSRASSALRHATEINFGIRR